MPSSQREPLLRTSSFEVLLGDREVAVSEVSGLTSVTDLDDAPERRVPRFGSVVLRRALTSSKEFFDWRKGIVDGRDDRRDVTIRLLSAPGGEIVNSWKLLRAWPCRWSGPTLNALGNEVACEELELTFDDLVWLDHHGFVRGG